MKALWSHIARAAARINNHPVWVVFAVLVTALGIVFTLLSILRGSEGPGVSSQALPTTERGSTSSAVPVDGDIAESSIGLCFVGSGEVPCDTEHEFQVFSEQPCSSRELMVSFLGGSPSIEVLTPSIGPVEKNLEGNRACAVHPPPGASVSRSAADILQTTLGDSWRRCLDERIEAEVACSVPHTAEVVYIGKPSGGESLDCQRRAEEYLEAPLRRFSFQLSVETIEIDDEPACALVVLGANELTRSIRGIGTSTLPIATR